MSQDVEKQTSNIYSKVQTDDRLVASYMDNIWTWEKIFANNATDKGLIFKIHKQFIQLNIKNNKKWAEDLDISTEKPY